MIAGSSTLLQLSHVEKIYGTAANPLQVLYDVNLTVRAGEYVAIIGRSGAGKSTMLNILGCLDRPTRGDYYLMGDNVAEFDDEKLSRARKQHIGFIFQSFQLVPHLSVLENVEMPLFYARQTRQARRRRCRELIARVGLSSREDHRPSQLSGGENQRAAIARALANDPAVVLADEPTGNLDSSTSDEIMNLLRGLHDTGCTILLITHDRDIARTAPRTVVLRDGRIVQDAGSDTTANVSV